MLGRRMRRKGTKQNNGAMGVSVQGGWVGATFLLCPVKILMVKALVE